MDIGSIFLILAILIPVAIYIGRPLMDRKGINPTQTGQELSTLLAERDQVIAAVKELDDDFNLGKIPAEIYPSQRHSLLQDGADILRQIDVRQSSTFTATTEERLEAAIVAHYAASDGTQLSHKRNGNAVPPVPDDELEQRIASRRRLKQGKAAGFCPKCGRPVEASDHFCPKCGSTLA